MRTRNWRNRAAGAGIVPDEPPAQGDHALQVESGREDSPERKDSSTFVPGGLSPSHRYAPNRLVRPVSLTAETYSPLREPLERRYSPVAALVPTAPPARSVTCFSSNVRSSDDWSARTRYSFPFGPV